MKRSDTTDTYKLSQIMRAKRKREIQKLSLSRVSNNTLEELRNLIISLSSEIQTYSHVSDNLPPSIQKEIDKFDKKVQKELEKRGY